VPYDLVMTPEELSHADYSAMTVNERLFASGFLARFDEAARSGDRDAMRATLRCVALSEADASRVIEFILCRRTSGEPRRR
jgi:hypothetical protein